MSTESSHWYEREGAWRAVSIVAWVAVVAAAGSGAWVLRQASLREISRTGAAPPHAPVTAIAEPVRIPPRSWVAVRCGPGGPSTDSTPSASSGRFRLAGILATWNEGGAPSYRKAILDDLQTRQQYLAGEDEMAGPARVLRVLPDSVRIQWDGRVEELRLTYDQSAGTGAESASTALANPEEPAPLEVNRFGKRIFENRWKISREAMTAYYREMLDNPERVAKLYESFEPNYANGKISGYRINMHGEEDFMNALGLKQDDVVRQVNSMNMTSQSRAEFFIGEFLKERLNAIVLDIDRGGEQKKLVYLVE